MQLLIGKTVSLPLGGSAAAIENRRKLAVPSFGKIFPKATHSIRHKKRHANGEKFYLRFVGRQKFSAGEQFVIHDVENLAVHTRFQSGQNNCVRAIVHKGQRKLIRAAQVNKESKGINSHAAT